MSATAIAALIAGAGFLLSLIATLLVVGIAYGRLRGDVTQLQEGRRDLATKDQVEVLARDISEIKGMFRITLAPEHGGTQ